MTNALADFILSRIAEDEARAERWRSEGAWVGIIEYGDPVTFDSEPWVRVLAECRSKRRIVELHNALDEAWEGDCPTCGMQDVCHTLRAVALPYVGHPEFRNEWRRP